MTRNCIGVALLAALAAALAASCGDDSPVAPPITVVPESWRGVWRLHLSAVACNFNVSLLDTTITQDICPGDSLRLPFDLGDSVCASGSVQATEGSIRFTCSGPYSQAGCTGTVAVSLTMNIDPTLGTISGSGQANLDFTNCTDFCVNLGVTGTRLSGEPTCTPAGAWRSASPWGAAVLPALSPGARSRARRE